MKAYPNLPLCGLVCLLLPTLGLPTIGAAQAKAGGCTIDMYTSYYPAVRRAEDHVLAEQWSAASHAYHQLFELTEHPFNADLHNATLVALRLDSVVLARRYIDKMVSQGVDPEWVETSSGYLSVTGDTTFLQSLKQKEQAYQSTLNNRQQACFAETSARDQQIRAELRPDDPMFARGDSINMVDLMSCIDEHGFPNQVDLNLATPMDQRYTYALPLLHEIKRINKTKEDRFEVIGLIDSLTRCGYIEAATYIQLMRNFGTKIGGLGQFGNASVIKLEGSDSLFQLVYSPSEIQEIDENRRRIGHRPLKEHIEIFLQRHTGNLPEGGFLIPRDQTLTQYPRDFRQYYDLKFVGMWEVDP